MPTKNGRDPFDRVDEAVHRSASCAVSVGGVIVDRRLGAALRLSPHAGERSHSSVARSGEADSPRIQLSLSLRKQPVHPNPLPRKNGDDGQREPVAIDSLAYSASALYFFSAAFSSLSRPRRDRAPAFLTPSAQVLTQRLGGLLPGGESARASACRPRGRPAPSSWRGRRPRNRPRARRPSPAHSVVQWSSITFFCAVRHRVVLGLVHRRRRRSWSRAARPCGTWPPCRCRTARSSPRGR